LQRNLMPSETQLHPAGSGQFLDWQHTVKYGIELIKLIRL